jgi:hypothetical protein
MALVATVCGVALFPVTSLVGPTPAAASASARHAGPRTRLCESTGLVTRLVVRRTDAFPQNHFRFSFPSAVSVDDATSARKVARALCSLPPVPDTMISCPADFGISYHLQFFRGRARFRVATLDATGCQMVRGLAQGRWIARTPDFWHVLGTAMRVQRPSAATFRGSGPTG